MIDEMKKRLFHLAAVKKTELLFADQQGQTMVATAATADVATSAAAASLASTDYSL